MIGNNKLYIRGSMIVKSLDAKNNAEIFIDEDSVSTGTGGGRRWQWRYRSGDDGLLNEER
jgi:hypothetical protein